MKDAKPHPCIKCKETTVKRVNLCPHCVKEVTEQIKAHYRELDKKVIHTSNV